MSSRFRDSQRCAAAAALLLASNTLAAPVGTEAIRLRYRAPPGCPTEARFWDEIAMRTSRVRRAGDGEPARVFSVVVDARAGGSRGELDSTDLQGVMSHRDVTGDDCAEVVSALALIAALTVDTQARTDPAAALTPATGAEIQSNPSASSSAAAGATPGPTASASAPPPRIDVPEKSPTQAPTTTGSESNSPSNIRWSVGAQAQAIGGLTPSWALGGGVFVDVEDASAEVLSPAFRLGAWADTTDATFAGALGAEITWYGARLEACPVRPVLAPALRLEGCVGVDVGAMRSTGVGVDHPDTASKLWLAPLVLGRLGWTVSQGFRAELGLGLTVPATTHPFAFDPGTGQAQEISRIRPVGALFTLGAAYEFP